MAGELRQGRVPTNQVETYPEQTPPSTANKYTTQAHMKITYMHACMHVKNKSQKKSDGLVISVLLLL